MQAQRIRCGAKNRDGSTCKTWARKGATRCRMHGANTKTTLAKAARQEQHRKAQETAIKNGIPELDDPLRALRELAAEVLAIKNYLRDGLARASATGTSETAVLGAYERALDRCGRILGDIARLNIDERLAVLTEKQAERVVFAVEAGLGELDLPPENDQRARDAVARYLSRGVR